MRPTAPATLMLSALTFITAASTALQPSPARPRAVTPLRLAIYYGYPSLVNGSGGNVERAAATFARYDVIVLGDGLQFSDVQPRRRPRGVGADEHRKTRAIINRLRSRPEAQPEIYGYVDLGSTQALPMPEIHARARMWRELGATGIFLDEAGYDFGVTRRRQNEAVEAIRGLGMRAFLNAFNPDDVFSPEPVPLNRAGGGNPEGHASQLGAQDAFLLESFQVRLGEPDPWTAATARTARALGYREQFKTRVFGVTTTTAATAARAADLLAYAWWSAVLWGLDGFGWGEPDFSGPSSELPARLEAIDAAGLAGATFTSPVLETMEGLERRTTRGRIVVRRSGGRAGFEPRH